MVEHEYKKLKVSDLIPYVNNSRTHSEEQINQVAASIKEFGFTNPILVDEDGGIIAGHGRVMAAKKLGLKEAPCIELIGLTATQKKAYIIADNQLALNAGWDMDMLKLEVETLEELDFDVDLLGFDGITLDNLLAEGGEAGNAEEEWEGMPEFDQGDKTSFKKIIVHFATEAHLQEFARIIGQSLTLKTQSVWHPRAVIETYADKSYE